MGRRFIPRYAAALRTMPRQTKAFSATCSTPASPMPMTRPPAPRWYTCSVIRPLYMKLPFDVCTPMCPGPSNCVPICPISVATNSS
jgi:hypothetical protein